MHSYRFRLLDYHDKCFRILAKVKQTASGEQIIVICDQYNIRVHESIPSAGNKLIMDATSNLDRNYSKKCPLNVS